MASHGKVLDLLDDRYLELQDVFGNVEPVPALVPYEEYTQNVLVYRMDTNHDIFLGILQDFTFRRAHEVRKELWTWLVQWEVDDNPPIEQHPLSKKVRLDAQQANSLFIAPPTTRKTPALTIFERRTLDGALMLEEDMLRILIDIVQVASSLVPNFIEFLYRWIDYYEGDGKALKAALRWEIPSLWDFEYHPLLLPRDDETNDGIAREAHTGGEQENRAVSVSASRAAELRQGSPTKKMHARPKPDLASIERQTFYTEESERLQYREVKFGIQPPKLEQALPPLINIPRDFQKRTKYYAACFKSRQRALYLLLEAGVTMHQINNYQKLQTVHPKETSEAGDGDGLRNYQMDAKYAQARYEVKEKQTKQREISFSNKLAIEAQLAATHAIPDGAAGLPLIPPTPSFARNSGMAAEMMQRIVQTRALKDDGKINFVPQPLHGLLKSKVFESAQKQPELKPLRDYMAENEGGSSNLTTISPPPGPRWQSEAMSEDNCQDVEMEDDSSSDEEDDSVDDDDDDDDDDDSDDGDSKRGTTAAAIPVLGPPPRPMLFTPLPPQASAATVSPMRSMGGSTSFTAPSASNSQLEPALDQSTPPNIAAYMQNLNTEQAQRLLPLLSPQARQAASSRLQQTSGVQSTISIAPTSSHAGPAGPTILSQPSPLGPPSGSSTLPSSSPAPTLIAPPFYQTGHNHHRTGQSEPGHTISPIPPPATGSLMLPRQRTPNLAHRGTLAVQPQQSSGFNLPVPSPGDSQSWTRAEGGHKVRAFALSPSLAQSSVTDVRTHVPVSPSFDPDVFMRLRRQQEAELARGGSSSTAATFQTETHTQSFHGLQTVQDPQALILSPSASVNLASPAATLPPARPGIVRNVPSSLSLSPSKPSPFNTLAPQILATSPFLAQPVESNTPIQIYLPRIIIPGNGIGPGGSRMGDGGCIETDALMLGHEDPRTRKIVLNKAILLPVGVWENTLRKARTGRWSVLETYACPSSHPAKGKGKGRMGDLDGGCHKSVYDKLAQACGMISSAPADREKELTKRWRTSPGPMTSSDRGAVWEGWGVYVDCGIEMSVEDRSDAMRSENEAVSRVEGTVADGYGPYSESDEVRRRREEMEELMDEDESEDESQDE